MRDRSDAARLSVILSTRDRASDAVACVRTIVANGDFDELIVVDQSADDATERALTEITDPRVRHLRTATRGVTTSRNLGAEMAVGDIVAFTDDDCRVAEDWVTALRRIFQGDPEVAAVCGRVRVAEEVRDRGFTEHFEPRVREWQGRFPPFGSDWGITANFAIRRDVFESIGGFDPLLGAGAALRSGGEPDLLFRLLRDGHKIVNASEAVVDHLGVRTAGVESQTLIRGYGLGTGAALFKHVRLGDVRALAVYLKFVAANVRRAGLSVLRTGHPDGLGFLLAFLWGPVASLRFKVDRDSRLYALRSDAPITAPGDAVEFFSDNAQMFDGLYGYAAEFMERVEVWSALLDRYATRDAIALDIGCGPGVFTFQLAERCRRVVGVDGSAEMVSACERRRHDIGVENVSFVQARLPFTDEALLEPADLVISSSVVEYVDDLDTVLAQLARLVKPGGTMIVSMPNTSSISRTYQQLKFRLTGKPEVYRHIKHFASPRSLTRRVASHGVYPLEHAYYTHMTRIAKVARRAMLPRSLSEDLFVAVFRRPSIPQTFDVSRVPATHATAPPPDRGS